MRKQYDQDIELNGYYAIIFIKTHFIHLTALVDIIFGMYTQNSVRNDKIYMNLHNFIIRGHRGQLHFFKIH